MVKRKVVWTETAIRQRREIFKYWNERNQSKLYSKKLLSLIFNHIQIISTNPEAFKETEIGPIRESAMGHFSLYYITSEVQIVIVAFWDNRQDPDKLLELVSQ